MIKNTLQIVLGLVVLAIALIASERPDAFRVSRSAFGSEDAVEHDSTVQSGTHLHLHAGAT